MVIRPKCRILDTWIIHLKSGYSEIERPSTHTRDMPKSFFLGSESRDPLSLFFNLPLFSNSLQQLSDRGAMELVVVTLIIGFLLSLLLLVPRFIKSDQTKKLHLDTNSKTVKAYNKAEVSLHNKRTDCWIIIKEKVYDVTPYVEEHPGGDAILDHAGDDSTEGFFGPQHATRVFDMIEDFYIGDLEK